MNFRLFLLALLISLFQLSSWSQTKLGLRANSAPWQVAYYDSLNAEVGRQIVKDNFLNPSFNTQFNSSLLSLKQIGVSTIVCLRFPTNELDSEGSDRSPYLDPTDLDTSLSKVVDFLNAIGANLDYIQLQNEPIFGPGKYMDTLSDGSLIHLGYYGYKWMDTLAYTIQQVIQNNGLSTQIIGPAFHDVENALNQSPETNQLTFILNPNDTVFAGDVTSNHFPKPFEELMMDVSLDYCDLIDVHLNLSDINQIDQRVDNLDSLQLLRNGSVAIAYTSLEWSQAFEKQDLINSTPAYHQFLDDAYNGLVSLSEWRSFIIDTLNYDTTFIQSAFCKMNDYNFAHACYAGLIMYGNPNDDFAQIFSTVALLTNEVTPTLERNEPFYSLFQNVNTNCNLSTPKLEEFDPYIIWPNPAETLLYIEGNSKNALTSVHIYSPSGQLIKSIDNLKDRNKLIMDISSMETGSYILIIRDEEGFQSKRFIKN